MCNWERTTPTFSRADGGARTASGTHDHKVRPELMLCKLLFSKVLLSGGMSLFTDAGIKRGPGDAVVRLRALFRIVSEDCRVASRML